MPFELMELSWPKDVDRARMPSDPLPLVTILPIELMAMSLPDAVIPGALLPDVARLPCDEILAREPLLNAAMAAELSPAVVTFPFDVTALEKAPACATRPLELFPFVEMSPVESRVTPPQQLVPAVIPAAPAPRVEMFPVELTRTSKLGSPPLYATIPAPPLVEIAPLNVRSTFRALMNLTPPAPEVMI
ncbi:MULTISPECIES: hypothetical protein [Bradyrhizobium]|uniref:hypothetical protein n=1 Tax=Bradyrhizobium TaxID=374 RepID=UPI000FB42A96|nr:hypothetical protein [Bradyrhizobium denitrificans]MCL8484778.1 hypothetical protein [Bradyrhizobium denitrificans]RTL98618.1 MAG: hypothetical protein EKK32_18380 [Bradyrhizobiaceae bacterium]